ncbi:MAG: SRPBCC family protein [Lacisediminihabitans sp.]
MSTWTFSESIIVACTPEELHAMVSDITRMGEWSPVCTGGWWDDESRGAGAWFVGHNETPERTWETRSQVVADEPAREFAFIVGGDRTRWGYSFRPVDSGTEMTESWEVLPGGEAYFSDRFGAEADAEIGKRAEAARSGIPETLAAIKKVAEAS